MMGFGFSDREIRFATAMFFVGFCVGMPVIIGGVGYGVYRVIVAAVRGW